MASNEVEILDPAATVEKDKNTALDRRNFMAALGVAGVAAGAAALMSGTRAIAQSTLAGFSQIDVMNFLLQTKYLKATLLAYRGRIFWSIMRRKAAQSEHCKSS